MQTSSWFTSLQKLSGNVNYPIAYAGCEPENMTIKHAVRLNIYKVVRTKECPIAYAGVEPEVIITVFMTYALPSCAD